MKRIHMVQDIEKKTAQSTDKNVLSKERGVNSVANEAKGGRKSMRCVRWYVPLYTQNLLPRKTDVRANCIYFSKRTSICNENNFSRRDVTTEKFTF